MRWSTSTALTLFCLVGASGFCQAQTASPAAVPADKVSTPPAPAPTADKAAPLGDPTATSFDALVGKKLTAIDGSSISLSPAEGGIAREIVSSSGTIQRTYFAFISDRLGTVADASDIRKVTGVFRRVPAGMEIEYADGSTEKLGLNPGGGLTQESIGAKSDVCVSWYPEGHTFSVEERKAALAAFAVKLGLADAATISRNDCGRAVASDVKPVSAPVNAPDAKMAVETGKVTSEPEKRMQTGKGSAPAVPPIPSRAPRGIVTASNKAPVPTISPATTAALAAETQSVEVRKSEVHLIDPPPAPEVKPQVLASITPPATEAKPQVLASGTPPPPLTADQRGASTCLSVESDGMHWGFRNHCGYDVQFAYCLMDGNPLASCHDGAVAGSVAANGFGALVADESLKETDAKHDFRWVACQGGAGEVIPHLDQIDPPSGRCVR